MYVYYTYNVYYGMGNIINECITVYTLYVYVHTHIYAMTMTYAQLKYNR